MPDYTEARANRLTPGKTEPAIAPNGARARRIVVRAESYWYVRSPPTPGQEVYADGSGPGAHDPPDPNSLPLPGAPPWSLIAAWVSQGQVVNGWFYVGNGNTFNNPADDWPMSLVYECNDDNLADNDGYLHVYEDWEF